MGGGPRRILKFGPLLTKRALDQSERCISLASAEHGISRVSADNLACLVRHRYQISKPVDMSDEVATLKPVWECGSYVANP